MAKLVLNDVTNLLGNPTSAQTTINNNSELIEAALEKTLSRDGISPNQMMSDLDMNHHDILNTKSISTDQLILDGKIVVPGEDLVSLPDMFMTKPVYDPYLIGADVFDRRNQGDFNTEAEFLVADISPVVLFVTTAGYYSAGDGGGHTKVRISTPDPVEAWHKQNSDGSWWSVSTKELGNPRIFGAVGDGVTDDTTPILDALEFKGKVYLPEGSFAFDATDIDVRLISGPGLMKFNVGTEIYADSITDRGPMGQRYFTEVKNSTNNSVTQSIAVHGGKLYRSQEKTSAGPNAEDSYRYDTTVDVTEFDLPAGDGRSRTSIDYTSDVTTQLPIAKATVKGLGHGDGIALITEGGQTWIYGHCSAPPGSSDPANEATGYVKFPWLGSATALEPAGSVFYRDLMGVGNPNFGMSSDGKYLLFVQRNVNSSGVTTLGASSVTTYQVIVHDRKAIESAADHKTVPPVSKFVVAPSELYDTLYAQAGITSDGKYIYITFSGARVVGKTFLHTYTMSGDFVKESITSGMRAEDVRVYMNGKSGWLPAFYETEGLTMHGDKLLTSSRYLFTLNSPVVTWKGARYVYIGTNPASGVVPNNVGSWAPTMAPATAGNWSSGTTYTRGSVRFHHYITAYVTSGQYGTEEFAIDVDPYNHPYVENSFNGMVSSRTDYSICYYPLNTQWVPAIATFRLNGEHYFYNAEKLTDGGHTINHGAKININDTDVRFQNISGLGNSGAVVLTNTANSLPESVLMYAGGTTLTFRFASAGNVSYGYVRPSADNTYTCGHPSFKWTVVYAQTGTINTSDEREKTFEEILEAEHLAAQDIKKVIRKYRFNSSIAEKGEGARLHFGVAAQQVGEIMMNHGLDPHDYSFFCFDEWKSEPEKIDEVSGKVVEPAIQAGNRYGIRYDELLCFIIAAM